MLFPAPVGPMTLVACVSVNVCEAYTATHITKLGDGMGKIGNERIGNPEEYKGGSDGHEALVRSVAGLSAVIGLQTPQHIACATYSQI